MREEICRTALLLGNLAMKKLEESTVAIFGVGGVGGYVAEALARSGVGKIVLIDKDEVSVSNINRQIIALHSTVGKHKVDVMKERILDINPEAQIETRKTFFLPDNSDTFDFKQYDYVVDAVDTVTAKLELVMKSEEAGVPVISSMGAGNKLDATAFKVADIYETKVCPLAKVMRKELKARGIDKLKVVYSEEQPFSPDTSKLQPDTDKKRIPGSVAFVPSVVGLIIAGEVIKDLTEK